MMGFRNFALFLALAATGCGQSMLVVDLVYLVGDDPFSGATLMRVTATTTTTGESAEVVERELTDEPIDGDGIELPELGGTDGLELRIGAESASEDVIAEGVTTPVNLGQDQICCLTVCFCSSALFTRGSCGCGSDICTADCL